MGLMQFYIMFNPLAGTGTLREVFQILSSEHIGSYKDTESRSALQLIFSRNLNAKYHNFYGSLQCL